jgi:hypothetical protein
MLADFRGARKLCCYNALAHSCGLMGTTTDKWRACGDASRALLFMRKAKRAVRTAAAESGMAAARHEARRAHFVAVEWDQEAAARGARLRELRWKNNAWLATAETIAGWNGFEIRNAGSGRSPVRKRSG